MDIIEKIKDRRKELKLTQKQIAEKISEISPISQAAYAKIESGATVGISIEYAKGIAKALDVSFNELFEIENSAHENNSVEFEKKIEEHKNRILELEKTIALYEKLNKSFQNAILEANSEASSIFIGVLNHALKNVKNIEQKQVEEIMTIFVDFRFAVIHVLKRKGFIDEKTENEYIKNGVLGWLVEDDPIYFKALFKK